MTATIPTEMRALVLAGAGFDHLSVRTVPTPRPGPGQLLARVDAASVCTSLIKLVEQGPRHAYLYDWDLESHPVILGDEGSVTLVEVGDQLKDRYELGQRFTTQSSVNHPPINHRERYRDGGRGIEKLGIGHSLPGHLAEYILVTEETIAAGCLLPVADLTFPSSHASLAEPISCVISAQEHHLYLAQESPNVPRQAVKGLRKGGVTVIVGCGAMGRMHVDLAFSSRPASVIGMDFVEERLEKVETLFGERARRLGVKLATLNPERGDPLELVREATGGRGADDVIVAVGSAPAIVMAQSLVGTGGVLNLFGGLKKGEDTVDFDTSIVHYKEVNVTGSSGGSPWDVVRALELMLAGEIDAGKHITRIGDLEHLPDFLEMIRARTLDGKAVVYPHRRVDSIRVVPQWTAGDETRFLAE